MAVLALAQLVGGDSGEVFDLGGDEALSVGELAQLVVAQVGRPLDIRLNTANRGVAEDRFVPDLQRSIDRFGIMPAFSVAQAITRSLAWYAS
jgi:nucleoside-diphosphate-sugar epimerase